MCALVLAWKRRSDGHQASDDGPQRRDATLTGGRHDPAISTSIRRAQTLLVAQSVIAVGGKGNTMTQSKDGMGRTPGTTNRLPGQRAPGAAGGVTSEFPMLPHPSAVSSPSASPPASDTDEMQDLLRKIASQIADAEQRQGVALDGMQSRLTDLADQTEAVKAQAPKDLQPGLNSIEDKISEIAETVVAAGREIKGGGLGFAQCGRVCCQYAIVQPACARLRPRTGPRLQ